MCRCSPGSEASISRLSGRDSRRSRKSSETRTASACLSDTGRTCQGVPTFETSPIEISAQLGLFPADSPASRSALPGSVGARMMTATSGRRCLESYERLHPDGSWQKTFLASCLLTEAWSSRLCYLTWSLRATKHSRWYVQLRARVPRTYDSECSSSAEPGMKPTPRASDGPEKSSHGRTWSTMDFNLHSYVKMWPTPRASDNDQGYRGDESSWKGQMRGETLHNAVKRMLPTPTAGMADRGDRGDLNTVVKGYESPSGHTSDKMLPTPAARDWKSGTGADHGKHAPPLSSAIGGSLNPEWVEWLQGFPIGWTDCEPSETP